MATNRSSNSVPQGTDFENMKDTGFKPPQTEAERQPCKRPGEAIHEGEASVAVKTSGFKVVVRTDKASYHTAESESPKRCQESVDKGAVSVRVKTPSYW